MLETVGAESGRSAPGAARAALACAVLTALSLGVGVVLMAGSGARSGADLAAGSRIESVRDLQAWLMAAEVLKLAAAAGLLVVMNACRRRAASGLLSRSALVAGYAAVFALAAGGALGLVAAASVNGPPTLRFLAVPVVALGLASGALTGVWAGLSAARSGPLAASPLWLRSLGYALGVFGLVALVFPPAALVFGLLSLGWWGGLAAVLRRRTDLATPASAIAGAG